MKTPEEIKRGLLKSVPVHFHKGNPEPRLTPLAYKALEELLADALAYIRQLEREKEAFMDDAKGLCGLCKHMYKTCSQHPCRNCTDGSNWEWRGVEEEKRET